MDSAKRVNSKVTMSLSIAREYMIDVLVVGAGGAGLRAAIEIAQEGVSVLVVSKELLGAAHTCMAEGGLNVALTEVNPANHPEIHLQDTLAGGAYLNRGSLAHAMAYEAPDRVHDLERFGVIFDRDGHGHIAQRFSGKQTHPHTVFVGDYTGQAIMAALVEQARRLQIGVWSEHFVSTLFKTNGIASGALVIDQHSGELTLVRARAVILCTGGGGRMYSVTTNAASNTADGYALALQIGAELVDMEMIQFHPTGMILPSAMRGKLVTESVRGEGGRLFNRDGERFMERYNPQRLELAGRDEVARAIFSEVQAGRGTDQGGVYLSVAHLPAELIEQRLPTMLTQFLAAGVDIRKAPMQIHPSMHHMMGGIRIDEWGACNVPGLFAAGEVTGGDHGGNRLGGNALASCQVMGKRAAISAAKFAAERLDLPAIDLAQVKRALEILDQYLQKADSPNSGEWPDTAHGVLGQLQTTMWQKVGIMRTESELLAAKEMLDYLNWVSHDELCAASSDPRFNRSWIDCLELRNMVITAQVVVYAALLRQDSRGAHFRRDFPHAMPDWERRNIVVRHDQQGDLVHEIINQSEL